MNRVHCPIHVVRLVMMVLLSSVLAIVIYPSMASAAVGCTLNEPDRDVRRIFPQATGYKTEFIAVKDRGGDGLAIELETRLGDKLDDIYETPDVPYAYYTVLKGKQVIGRVHGVNQKGQFGGMQLILATDPDGAIVDFYYQKISSPESKRFRDKVFTGQFKGLTMADFYRARGETGAPAINPAADRVNPDVAPAPAVAVVGTTTPTANPVSQIKDPTEKSSADFKATIRGLTKNLILLDMFMFENKQHEAFIKASKGQLTK